MKAFDPNLEIQCTTCGLVFSLQAIADHVTTVHFQPNKWECGLKRCGFIGSYEKTVTHCLVANHSVSQLKNSFDQVNLILCGIQAQLRVGDMHPLTRSCRKIAKTKPKLIQPIHSNPFSPSPMKPISMSLKREIEELPSSTSSTVHVEDQQTTPSNSTGEAGIIRPQSVQQILDKISAESVNMELGGDQPRSSGACETYSAATDSIGRKFAIFPRKSLHQNLVQQRLLRLSKNNDQQSSPNTNSVIKRFADPSSCFSPFSTSTAKRARTTAGADRDVENALKNCGYSSSTLLSPKPRVVESIWEAVLSLKHRKEASALEASTVVVPPPNDTDDNVTTPVFVKQEVRDEEDTAKSTTKLLCIVAPKPDSFSSSNNRRHRRLKKYINGGNGTNLSSPTAAAANNDNQNSQSAIALSYDDNDEDDEQRRRPSDDSVGSIFAQATGNNNRDIRSNVKEFSASTDIVGTKSSLSMKMPKEELDSDNEEYSSHGNVLSEGKKRRRNPVQSESPKTSISPSSSTTVSRKGVGGNVVDQNFYAAAADDAEFGGCERNDLIISKDDEGKLEGRRMVLDLEKLITMSCIKCTQSVMVAGRKNNGRIILDDVAVGQAAVISHTLRCTGLLPWQCSVYYCDFKSDTEASVQKHIMEKRKAEGLSGFGLRVISSQSDQKGNHCYATAMFYRSKQESETICDWVPILFPSLSWDMVQAREYLRQSQSRKKQVQQLNQLLYGPSPDIHISDDEDLPPLENNKTCNNRSNCVRRKPYVNKKPKSIKHSINSNQNKSLTKHLNSACFSASTENPQQGVTFRNYYEEKEEQDPGKESDIKSYSLMDNRLVYKSSPAARITKQQVSKRGCQTPLNKVADDSKLSPDNSSEPNLHQIVGTAETGLNEDGGAAKSVCNSARADNIGAVNSGGHELLIRIIDEEMAQVDSEIERMQQADEEENLKSSTIY